MTHFKQNTLAAVMAVVITVVSLQAIVNVPPVHAATQSAAVVELA